MNPRERLIQFEETHEYVFHGSPVQGIETFELKQSTQLGNDRETTFDGDPAVSATPYVDIAIFRAIINGINILIPDYESEFGIDGRGKAEFAVSSPVVLEEVKNKKGFVYVFNKKDFKPYSRNGRIKNLEQSMEWRSYQSIKPLDVIEVTFSDLPKDILVKID